jgi:hypothetical protein
MRVVIHATVPVMTLRNTPVLDQGHRQWNTHPVPGFQGDASMPDPNRFFQRVGPPKGCVTVTESSMIW